MGNLHRMIPLILSAFHYFCIYIPGAVIVTVAASETIL